MWGEFCGVINEPVIIRGKTNVARVHFLTERNSPDITDLTISWYFAPCKYASKRLSENLVICQCCSLQSLLLKFYDEKNAWEYSFSHICISVCGKCVACAVCYVLNARSESPGLVIPKTVWTKILFDLEIVLSKTANA